MGLLRVLGEMVNGWVWGTGNPVVDTYHTNWNTFSGRDTGQPGWMESQSEEDFIKEMFARQSVKEEK